MQFNIKMFHTIVKSANLFHSNKSSLSTLDTRLAALNGQLNPTHLAEIQQLWAFIPHNKQQKYKRAGNYLKKYLPRLVDAIPVEPKMHYELFRILPGNIDGVTNFPARFYHQHRLTWESSNGNLQSLSNVGTREKVVHRTSPTAAPFDPIVNRDVPAEFTQGATTNAGANIGYCNDDHSIANPSILTRRPLISGSLIADQVYEYTTDGQNWLPIPGALYEIEKGVRASGGGLVFVFRKQGVGGDPFHFEIEYQIGNKPNYAKKVPVIQSAFVPTANLTDHARIIQGG